MILCFNEKYADRYVEGENFETISRKILTERIDSGEWYYEDTERAQKHLDAGQAYDYLLTRINCEYEYFFPVDVEKA